MGGGGSRLGGSRRLRLWWAATWLVHIVAAVVGVGSPRLVGYRAVSPFSDPQLYHEYARLIARGWIPLVSLTTEYPPLAIPFFVVPYVVAAPLASFLGDLPAYYAAFAGEMLLVDAVAIGLIARTVERLEGIDRVPGRLAWYSAYFIVLCPLVVVRFDLAPMLAAFAAAVSMRRGRGRVGGCVAGVGAMVKAVPALVIVPLLGGSRATEAKVRAAGALALVVGGGGVVVAVLGGEMALKTITFHLGRGVEINTIYASGYMLAHEALGIKLSCIYNHSCMNVQGVGTQFLARAAILIQLGCLAAVAWRAYRDRRPYSIRLAGAAILAFIIGSKVLSPQYLIWLMPFVAVAGPGRGLFLACCVLTTATYPWYFGELSNLGRTAEVLLFARNVGLIWLFALQLRAQGDEVGDEERSADRRAGGDASPEAAP